MDYKTIKLMNGKGDIVLEAKVDATLEDVVDSLTFMARTIAHRHGYKFDDTKKEVKE